MATSHDTYEEGSSVVQPDAIMSEARTLEDTEGIDNFQDAKEHEQEYNWIKIAGRIRRYKASIKSSNLEITGIPGKLQLVQHKVGQFNDFLGVKAVYFRSESYILAEFGSKESRDEACKIQIEENNEFKLESIENKGDDDFRNRSMTLRNLPLGINKATIRNAMERKGEDIVTDIKTRVQGPWLTAVVTFANQDTVKKLANQWYILIGKDLVKLSPLNITKEEITARNAFTVKLANLPFGITAYDLLEIVERTKAKGCFIPRTNGRYDRLRFAIFNFENEEEMHNVFISNDQFEIKGKHLTWLEMEGKTCHKCGSSEHLVKECGEIERQNNWRQRTSRYSRIYEKYQVPNYRRMNRYRDNYNNNNRQNRFEESGYENEFNNQDEYQPGWEMNDYEQEGQNRRYNWNDKRNFRNQNRSRSRSNRNPKENKDGDENQIDLIAVVESIKNAMEEIKLSLVNINERLVKLEKEDNQNTRASVTPHNKGNLNEGTMGPRFPSSGPVNNRGQIKVGTIPIGTSNYSSPVNRQQNVKRKNVSSEEENNANKIDHRTQFLERGIKRSNFGNSIKITNKDNASSSNDESDKEKVELRNKLNKTNEKMDDINKKLDLLMNKNFALDNGSSTNKIDNMQNND